MSPLSSQFLQIKQVLLDLSLSYDNFLEVNAKFIPQSKLLSSVQNRSPSPSKPIRKSSSSSSSSSSCSSDNRKRSWDSEDITRPTEISQAQIPRGKRSKSLVLTQELEGLCLSSSNYTYTNKLDLELKEWADQDLELPRNDGDSISLNVLFGELSNGGIDHLLKVLSTCPNVLIDKSVQLNHWIKWSVINETCESIRLSKQATLKTIQLFSALNRMSPFIDWADPEIVFLLHKLLLTLLTRLTLLNSDKFRNIPRRNSANRRLEGYFGILRILNLFFRLPTPKSVQEFLFSRQETFSQMLLLLQSLLELNLNIFEDVSVIFYDDSRSASYDGFGSGFGMANKFGTANNTQPFDTTHENLPIFSILLTLKIIENSSVTNPEIEKVILYLKERIS